MLTDIEIKDSYRSKSNDLLKEFYLPCLINAKYYYRATGFFNSSILNYISNGLYRIVKKEGKVRIICGVNLSKNDSKKIIEGYSERKVINDNIYKTVNKMFGDDISDNMKNLAWLIKFNYVDIKIGTPAIKGSGNSIFHEKLGIFQDEYENIVTFSGSINESSNGWLYNYESFDVYTSWDPAMKSRAARKMEYFEELWENNLEEVNVYDFYNEAKEHIVNVAPKNLIEEETNIYDKKNNASNAIKPRKYQMEAIENWKNNNYKGIYEMATGTGKTITAIFSMQEFLKNNKKSLVIIVCPYQHLVNQWYDELKEFYYDAIKCYKSKTIWETKLVNSMIDLRLNIISKLVVITTSSTSSGGAFQDSINRIGNKVKVLLIADEMHNLGTKNRRKILNEKFHGRLGLSATPRRWFDESGTKILYDYFKKTVYEYDLKKAITEGYLTRYDYWPIIVYLTDDEYELYYKYSKKIGILMSNDLEDNDEILKRLMIKRAKILNSAENKLTEFNKIIDEQSDLSYTLVYTSPELKDDIYKILQQKSIFFQRFTSRENDSERQSILRNFQKGDTDLLVAMRCLDEGVNVPATKKAFILSSSTNPKEFIQRRGRVLRKFPGKNKSIIYDFLVVPPLDADISSIRNILTREFKRFKEFADLADNRIMARKEIFDLAHKYKLLDEV